MSARSLSDASLPPWSALVVLGLAAAAVGWIGYRVAAPALASWYGELVKPTIALPGNVFAPIWAGLYILMALAAWTVLRSDAEPRDKMRAMRAFWIQLALSLTWSLIMFGARDPGWAFVEVLILLAALIIALLRFAKIDRRAGLLMLPQLGWSAYAALLTFLIWQLNLKA